MNVYKLNLISSLVVSLAIFLMLPLIFTVIEPTLSLGAATTTSQFTISQAVTSEISFKTPATNVTLSPSLGGISGGSATGTTQVVVATNNLTGYTMTITASSSVGMLGNNNPANSIPSYAPATPNVPDYNFIVPANKAYFGYSVSASTTAELATAFKDNGSACNIGALDTVDTAPTHCWLNASTTAVTLLNSSGPTASSGSTSTLIFHVVIAANPAPTIPNDTYVATTTLTAVTNP